MKVINYKGSIFHYEEETDTLYLFSPAEELYIPASAEYDQYTDVLLEVFPEDTSTDDSKTGTYSLYHDKDTIHFKKVSFLKPDGLVPVYENVQRIYIAAPIDNLIADNRNFPNLEKINFLMKCPDLFSIGPMFFRGFTLEYVFSEGMKQKCVLPSWGTLHLFNKLGPKALQHTLCTEIVLGCGTVDYCHSTFNGSRFMQQDTPILMIGNMLLRCRTSIELPENTEVIDPQAFCECQNDIEITVSLDTLGKIKTIPHHPNVKYIIINEVIDPNILLNMKHFSVFQSIIEHPDRYVQKIFAVTHDALFSKDKKTLIYVKHHKNICELDYIVPDTTEVIAPRAFANNNYIKSIKLPPSVTKIYPRAFYNCFFLQKISFPSKLKVIPAEACKSCKDLEMIEWPSELESIGREAFSECGLTTLSIPNTVQSVASGAFNSCIALQSAVLPNAQYGNSVFISCSVLKSVNLPDDMTVIPNSMFMMCDSLQKITLPKKLKTIQDGAFHSCDLDKIDIPDSVTSIGANAFINNPCQRIKLPDSLNSVGNNAFSANTLIVLPNKSLKIFASAYANNGSRNSNSPLMLIISHPDGPQQILKMSDTVNTGTLYRLDLAWQRGEFDKLEEIYFNGLPKISDEKFEFATEHLTDDPTSIYHIYLKAVANKIGGKLIEKKDEQTLSKLVTHNIFSENLLQEMLPLAQDKQMTAAIAYILEKLNNSHSYQDSLDL